jgi:hypothetical protein
MYEAGQTKQKYKIGREVEWDIWWFKVWDFTITWNWDLSITWVWFKPSLVQFQVCDQLWTASNTWIWQMTITNQNAINNTNSSQITTQCIYYWNPVKARAVYKSMDTDWFTITVSGFTATTYVNYIAFK